jgi:hypothetical protein
VTNPHFSGGSLLLMWLGHRMHLAETVTSKSLAGFTGIGRSSSFSLGRRELARFNRSELRIAGFHSAKIRRDLQG